MSLLNLAILVYFISQGVYNSDLTSWFHSNLHGPCLILISYIPNMWYLGNACCWIAGFHSIQDNHWTEAFLDGSLLWIGLLPYLFTQGIVVLPGSQAKSVGFTWQNFLLAGQSARNRRPMVEDPEPVLCP